jgi:hypothetical protein
MFKFVWFTGVVGLIAIILMNVISFGHLSPTVVGGGWLVLGALLGLTLDTHLRSPAWVQMLYTQYHQGYLSFVMIACILAGIGIVLIAGLLPHLRALFWVLAMGVIFVSVFRTYLMNDLLRSMQLFMAILIPFLGMMVAEYKWSTGHYWEQPFGCMIFATFIGLCIGAIPIKREPERTTAKIREIIT